MATGAAVNNNPSSPAYAAPERKMPAGMRIAHKTPQTANFPGKIIGGHVLVEPLGNPSLGRAMSWTYTCASCGALNTCATHSLPDLKNRRGCKHCARIKKPVNAP